MSVLETLTYKRKWDTDFAKRNLHNHNIDMYARVSLYKAVEVSNQKMSHVGDYVAYTGENEVY